MDVRAGSDFDVRGPGFGGSGVTVLPCAFGSTGVDNAFDHSYVAITQADIRKEGGASPARPVMRQIASPPAQRSEGE